jgi:hypothetical protein
MATPSGRRTAVASRILRFPSDGESIYVADVSGSVAPRPVSANGNRKIVTDWSGDGYLVYTELDPQTGADLKYLRVDGEGAAEPVVFRGDSFDTSFGAISPDGRWIALCPTRRAITRCGCKQSEPTLNIIVNWERTIRAGRLGSLAKSATANDFGLSPKSEVASTQHQVA